MQQVKTSSTFCSLIIQNKLISTAASYCCFFSCSELSFTLACMEIDLLLLFIIITGSICLLLLLVLCGVLAKILLNPGSIGEVRSLKGAQRATQSDASGKSSGSTGANCAAAKERHIRRPKTFSESESESTPPPHVHHPPAPPPRAEDGHSPDADAVTARRVRRGTRRGEKFKRPSKGNQGHKPPPPPPPPGSSQVTPSPGNIVELGFGALKSNAMMHMSICEPNKSDLSFTGGSPSRRATNHHHHNNNNSHHKDKH